MRKSGKRARREVVREREVDAGEEIGLSDEVVRRVESKSRGGKKTRRKETASGEEEESNCRNDFFEGVDVNRLLFESLSEMAQREVRQNELEERARGNRGTRKKNEEATRRETRPIEAKKEASSERTFTRLTKKMKTLYVLNVINRLRNQTVKFNVKKLFQIWLVYHRDDCIVKSICEIIFKHHTYDIARIREEILKRNQKQIKTKKPRDDNCRKICEENELLRIFDKKCLNYCLKNFQCSIMELKKKIPTILCFNESDIDHIVETCKREKNFPVHFLPNSVAYNVKCILNNRVPVNVPLTSTSATKI